MNLMLLLRSNTCAFSTFSKNLKIKIYKSIILSCVLYGCKAWSLTLIKEGTQVKFIRKLRPGAYIWIQKDDYRKDTKLHSDEHHRLHFSTYIL